MGNFWGGFAKGFGETFDSKVLVESLMEERKERRKEQEEVDETYGASMIALQKQAELHSDLPNLDKAIQSAKSMMELGKSNKNTETIKDSLDIFDDYVKKVKSDTVESRAMEDQAFQRANQAAQDKERELKDNSRIGGAQKLYSEGYLGPDEVTLDDNGNVIDTKYDLSTIREAQKSRFGNITNAKAKTQAFKTLSDSGYDEEGLGESIEQSRKRGLNIETQLRRTHASKQSIKINKEKQSLIDKYVKPELTDLWFLGKKIEDSIKPPGLGDLPKKVQGLFKTDDESKMTIEEIGDAFTQAGDADLTEEEVQALLEYLRDNIMPRLTPTQQEALLEATGM